MDPNNGKIDFVGNRTECALLVMTRNWGQDYKALRDLHHDATLGAPLLRVVWPGVARSLRSP